MATIKHTAPAATQTYLIDLTAISDGANSLGTGVISNDAAGELALFGDFEFYLSGTSLRTSDCYVDFFFITELDGTNYITGNNTVDPSPYAHFWRIWFPENSTLGIRAHKKGVLVPPTDFKILFTNNLSVSTPGAPSPTLKYSLYSRQVA